MATSTLWEQDPRDSIEQRHEQLLRATQSMWRLLKSRLDLSDADLKRLIIDTAQSETYELTAPQLIDCSVCQRPLRSNAKCCLYCGTAPRVELHSKTLMQTRYRQ
jgi:hypothetical protein